MNLETFTKRTTAGHPDFISLISLLDAELWHELMEDQAKYDQFNKVPDLQTAVVVYVGDEPVASGCFKQYESEVEIKRMYVKKSFRGKGISKLVLRELENWALELGFKMAKLETSIHFVTARKLYETNGYKIIPNYPPYIGLDDSICMNKVLAV